jgi:hypothetical protein
MSLFALLRLFKLVKAAHAEGDMRFASPFPPLLCMQGLKTRRTPYRFQQHPSTLTFADSRNRADVAAQRGPMSCHLHVVGPGNVSIDTAKSSSREIPRSGQSVSTLARRRGPSADGTYPLATGSQEQGAACAANPRWRTWSWDRQPRRAVGS